MNLPPTRSIAPVTTESHSSTNDQPLRVEGGYVQFEQERWYRIQNAHLMPEFFINPVSSSDHWMFVSSMGALSAGRLNPDHALFPYYCADKLVDMAGSTGAKTIFRVSTQDGGFDLWEPFARTSDEKCGTQRNVYKNEIGNKLILEETHHTLQLSFRYQWSFANRFGFVRSCRLTNIGSSSHTISILDGLQNLMPSGLDREFQLRYSNLGDAYKKNELVDGSRIGVFYLSSIPTDRAEPSEGLRATTVWHHGLRHSRVLLSDQQLERFRHGTQVVEEQSTRAHRGAYFVSSQCQLDRNCDIEWQIIADIDQDQVDVINLHQQITETPSIACDVVADVATNSDHLLAIVSAADGRQVGSDLLRVNRHQSNVMFNVMRGGLPLNGYRIDIADLLNHVRSCNVEAFERNRTLLNELSNAPLIQGVLQRVGDSGDAALIRIVSEYLPFTFSRRHGDPTRPWNSFSIDVVNPDGSPKLSYEGNWRDIFQNWEALALSYPDYATGMVLRFVNASTADGYNPYRLTKEGFEWETPDPDDPWANIGYWGDHQIVYLLRLLEVSHRFYPTQLNAWLSTEACAYAEIPYRIRSFDDIRSDPYDTIDYDFELSDSIGQRVAAMGIDGRLLQNAEGQPCSVSLMEKILVPILVKLTNFVPEGGVWLNTQRPEWNDANNALVGRGLSMVTTCYLRRFVVFLMRWLTSGDAPGEYRVSQDVVGLLRQIQSIIADDTQLFTGPLSAEQRHDIVVGLSTAGSTYRERLYADGLSAAKEVLLKQDCLVFLEQCRVMFDHTIQANQRPDGLYHSYNILSLQGDRVEVEHLYEMLEGQVAVVSCGILNPVETVEVLDALRLSRIYRDDQKSYMLYPDRDLPTFLEKNIIPETATSGSPLLQNLIADGDETVIKVDVRGEAHFCGAFRNASDLAAALDALAEDTAYSKLVDQDRDRVCQIFEQTFHHANFTGRSGTFFAYEGLGSIYWHMVSKLALAALENVVVARESGTDHKIVHRLHQHYCEIRDGLGITKSPEHYGAFPTDPYSHTPQHAGAQQPGMTGQVKEDILCRWTELGVRVDAGQLGFDPAFFDVNEFLAEDVLWAFCDQTGRPVQLSVRAGQFAFTVCQVPVVYERGDETLLTIHFANRAPLTRHELCLTADESASIFLRNGRVTRIEARFDPSIVQTSPFQITKEKD